MKKFRIVLITLSMLTLVGCNHSNGTKKDSDNAKEEQFEKETKKREQDAVRKKELVQEISVLRETIASMKKIQKDAEQMAADNTFEDLQANYDEGVTLGKDGIEELEGQLTASEAELNALK